uniref:Uncharacterized protein n=1 Tax=Opuntia streptacantha TaxID=393608 RepID=A0A7C9DQ55_OPUST
MEMWREQIKQKHLLQTPVRRQKHNKQVLLQNHHLRLNLSKDGDKALKELHFLIQILREIWMIFPEMIWSSLCQKRSKSFSRRRKTSLNGRINFCAVMLKWKMSWKEHDVMQRIQRNLQFRVLQRVCWMWLII